MAAATVSVRSSDSSWNNDTSSKGHVSSRRRLRARAILAASTLVVAGVFCAPIAGAQPAAQPAPPRAPAPAAPAPARPAAGAQPAAGPAGAPAGPTPTGSAAAGAGGTASDLGPGDPDVSKVDPLAVALAPQRGGLTPQGVGKEAIATSPAVASKQADIRAGEGQTEQAVVAFIPRVTLGASYTRLSPIVLPSLGGGNLVGTSKAGALTVAPCADGSGNQCLVDSAGAPAQSVALNFSFPVLLNQTTFTAGLVVPISDYFLRSAQAYSGAKHNESALRLALEAQNLQTAADAEITFLTWIQTKGQTVVAKVAIEDAQKQLDDAKTGIQVGTASLADVMRIDARLAQAQYQEVDAEAVERTAEERLRTVLHAQPDRKLDIGIDVLTQPAAPKNEATDALLSEALRNRLDIQSVEEQRLYLQKVADVTAASYAPRIEGFADATMANPNQRIFPSENKFKGSWDIGARLTWVLNDTFSTIGAVKAAKANTAKVEAEKQTMVDALRIEVTSAQADLAKSMPSIEAADRGVASSEETLRVTRKLFAFGKATGTQIVDAETDLTSSRLRKLAAHVNLIAAQIRLDHAVGRDRAQANR